MLVESYVSFSCCVFESSLRFLGLDLGGESCNESMERSPSIGFRCFDWIDLAGVVIVFDLVREAGVDLVAMLKFVMLQHVFLAQL